MPRNGLATPDTADMIAGDGTCGTRVSPRGDVDDDGRAGPPTGVSVLPEFGARRISYSA